MEVQVYREREFPRWCCATRALAPEDADERKAQYLMPGWRPPRVIGSSLLSQGLEPYQLAGTSRLTAPLATSSLPPLAARCLPGRSGLQ